MKCTLSLDFGMLQVRCQKILKGEPLKLLSRLVPVVLLV